VKKYLPLPKRYKKESPAECQEMYFRRTDIDCKYYVGYLNLQAFAVQYRDPTKPFWNVEKEYWQDFLKRNSQPLTYKDFGITKKEVMENPKKIFERGIKFNLLIKICCLKTKLISQLETIMIFLFGKSRAWKIGKFIWYLFKGKI
jgi:hypothetical protein